MDDGHILALRKANSMDVFADGDEEFCLGDWNAWEAACLKHGKTIPPSEFKAMPKENRLAYLNSTIK